MIDLRRDALLVFERQPHRLLRELKLPLRCRDARNLHASADVENEGDKLERVLLLLLRLAVVMARKHGQRFALKVRRDCIILQHRAELVADLLVEPVEQFLFDDHFQRMRAAFCKGNRGLPLKVSAKAVVFPRWPIPKRCPGSSSCSSGASSSWGS